MYRYRNKKTGETVVTSNRVTGAKWEEILPEQAPDQSVKDEPEQAPAKPGRKGKNQ